MLQRELLSRRGKLTQLSVKTTVCYILTFLSIYAVQYMWLGKLSVKLHPLAFGLPLLSEPHHTILAMYSHSSPSHLVKNVAMIAVFGVVCEQKVTTRQYHVLFLGIAIPAAILELTFHCGSTCVNVIGASGGIFGIGGYAVGSLSVLHRTLRESKCGVMKTILLAAVLAGVVGAVTLRPHGAPVAHGSAVFFGVILGQYELLPQLSVTTHIRLRQLIASRLASLTE